MKRNDVLFKICNPFMGLGNESYSPRFFYVYRYQPQFFRALESEEEEVNKANTKYTAPTEGRDVDKKTGGYGEHASPESSCFLTYPKVQKVGRCRKQGHSSNSRRWMLLGPEIPRPSVIEQLGGDKMELRSRGALKVVWRSSKHLMGSSRKGRGKAQHPDQEDDFWPPGYGERQEEAARGPQDPRLQERNRYSDLGDVLDAREGRRMDCRG